MGFAMNKVLIMMASYNGEGYIGQQIESIINQTYQDWNLVIQDDGSNDSTIDIIRSYCELDSRVSLRFNESDRHGAFPNFHSLANSYKNDRSYSYFMFCDQDDIWDKDKVEVMVESLEVKSEIHKPALLYADMRLIDQDNKLLNPSIDEVWKISGKNKYSYFFSHKVFGCNLIMNAALFYKVPTIDVSEEIVAILSHDNLYTKFAALFGEVYYLNKPLMSYRRHGKNQTTEQKYKMSLERILNRLLNLDDLARRHAITYSQTLYAVQLIKALELTDDENEFMNDVTDIIQGGCPSITKVNRLKINWGSMIENTSHKLILCLKMHKKHLK